MVNTKLNLSMTEPYVRQIYAKEGDTGRVLEIGLEDYPTENGTLRILRPDGVEVTADAIKSAGGDDYKGNLVTFDAFEEVPLTKCEVTLESTQDLHGYDNPWPGGGGVNKCGFGAVDFTYNSIHYWTENGILHRQGTSTGETSTTSTYWKDNLNFVLPAGTYFFTRWESTTNTATYLRKYDDGSLLATNKGSFTLTESTRVYVAFYVYQRTYDGSEIPLMIVEGSTDPTEYSPYSNICPIVASNDNEDQAIYVYQKGKNFIPNLKAQLNANTVVIGQQISNDTTTVYIPKGTFTLYVPYPSTVSVHHRFHGVSARIGDTNNAINLTFEEDGMHSFWLYKSGGVSVDDVGNFQLELGNTATSYEPYNGTTYPLSLGRSVYGGTVDLVSGKLVVDRVMIELQDANNWTKSSSYPGGYYWAWSSLATYYNIAGGLRTNKAYLKCSHAKDVYSVGEYASGTIFADNSCNLRIMDVNSTLNDWKQYVIDQYNAGTPIQIVRELITPQEYTLTPTQISTLLGENNIWSSGEVEVAFEYDGLLAQLPQQATAVVGRCLGDVDFNGASTMPFTLVVKPNNKENT